MAILEDLFDTAIVQDGLLGDAIRSSAAALSIELSAGTTTQIGVWHDWDTLKAVIVGNGRNDVLPEWYPDWSGKMGNEVLGPPGQTKEAFNPEMYRKANEQADTLCELLEREDVTVYRPPLLPPDVAQAPPVGLTAQYVRETLFPIGDTLIVGQMRAPHRNKDVQALGLFLGKLAVEGKQILRPPTCSLERNDDWEGDPRTFLEGGDIFRIGKSVLVTMSYLASSPAGYRWLANSLEPLGFEVWPAYMTHDWFHGDYILWLVREGLCVAYRKAFVDGLLPSPITDWDCIEITREEADNKFAANGITLAPGKVVLSEGSPRVRRALERKGCDVIEVPFDGVQYWQGGLDCSTADLWREGDEDE